jgi:hypothetical protein
MNLNKSGLVFLSLPPRDPKVCSKLSYEGLLQYLFQRQFLLLKLSYQN